MLFEHLDSTLERIGYGTEGSEYLKQSIMHNFKKLFGRTGLMQKEINMLRGILANIDTRVEEPVKPAPATSGLKRGSNG